MGENARIEGGLVCAQFCGGKFFQEGRPSGFADAADMADGAFGPVHTCVKFYSKIFLLAEEISEINLPLTDFVGVGRGDATPSAAARELAEDVDAVILPSEVKHTVCQVAHESTLVQDKT